ncbi:MAG TPA: hypothetical protein VNK89_13745 [Thermoflexus sp.]|nr:hypothetical protein [Thermoflexus sp.]
MLEDFEETFFPRARLATLVIPVLAETLEALQTIATAQGQAVEEIARIALAEGLAALQERMGSSAPPSESHPLRLHAELSVMRYRAFTLLKTVQALEMKVSSLQAELQILRAANADLQTRLQECQAKKK